MLELCDQSRQGFRLFIGGEVTAGQTLDPKAEFSQSFLREIDLPMLKRIIVAAAHQKRELIAISLEELTEVEPIALLFMIRHEACCGGEIEQAIVAVHRGIELTEFGIPYVIALGPHFPYSRHPLEQPEGTAHTLAGSVGKEAQHRRRVPRMC